MSKETIFITENIDQIRKDFDEFVYIVSHDLNAPLRHVKEFTKLIIESRQDNITDEELEFIRYLNAALQKINDMQVALLSYSRINTENTAFSNTDFNKALHTALLELKNIYGQDMPMPEFEILPTLYAHPSLIKTLFFNLIDNAVKFSKPPPNQNRIIIHSSEDDDYWNFEVIDSGIGIEEKYQKDVFQIFRKLDPQKYSGIGAGLAISKKIVRKHNGIINIQSTLGNGTKVFFSIDKNLGIALQ